jgi:hypothetical protein
LLRNTECLEPLGPMVAWVCAEAKEARVANRMALARKMDALRVVIGAGGNDSLGQNQVSGGRRAPGGGVGGPVPKSIEQDAGR